MARGMRVLPGKHTVVVIKEGYDKQVVEIEVAAAQALTRPIELLPEGEALVRRGFVPDTTIRRLVLEERQLATQAAQREQTRRIRIAGWATLGVALSTAIISCAFIGLSNRESGMVTGARDGTPWMETLGHYERSNTYRDVFTYGMVSAGIVAATSAVLLGLGYRHRAQEIRNSDTASGGRTDGRIGLATNSRN